MTATEIKMSDAALAMFTQYAEVKAAFPTQRAIFIGQHRWQSALLGSLKKQGMIITSGGSRTDNAIFFTVKGAEFAATLGIIVTVA
jgi:hypothetical protein